MLLCSCLFLVISAYKMGGVAAAALFLSKFQASHFAYVDIASSVLMALAIAGYVVVARRVNLRDMLLGTMIFFSGTYAIFWALARSHSGEIWVYPLFYVWVKTFGALGATQIWTLANYILTTREAKRVFGMVGAGAIAGGIFAGFLAKTLAKRFGTESLLLAMSALVFVCAVLVVVVWKIKGQLVAETHEASGGSSDTGPRNLFASMQLLFASPYLKAIAAAICISSVVTTLTGWQFLAMGQLFLVKKDAMAVFFGDFYFYAGLLGLLFQFLLTTRVLRKFGIGVAVFVLPVTVMFGSAGLLALGTLSAAVAMKGSEQILRYSLDKSAAELLYLPIATRVKLQVKWFIDTVVWRLGDGLSGIIVLIFATWLHLPARQISWVLLVMVGCWIVAVSVARQQYVVTLKESVNQHRVDVDQASTPILDRSTAELLASNLSASDPKEVLYALSLFEVEQKRAAHPVIRGLLSHSSSEVRHKAITILSEAGDAAALPEVRKLLRDPELAVRTEALLFVSHHGHQDPLEAIEEPGDFADFSVQSGVVAFLARPGDTQNLDAAKQILDTMIGKEGPEGLRNRLEAARLLGELPDTFDPALSKLLADPDVQVICEAMRSIGKLRKRRLVPELLDRLGQNSAVGPAAAQALSKFGNSIVGALRDHLSDPSVPMESRKMIPEVLVTVGTSTAANVLLDNLMEGDSALRYRTITALNKLHRSSPTIELNLQSVEMALAVEILGHYRSYEILATIGATPDCDEPLIRALKESMQQELERIFGLLGLLHPHIDVHSAYIGLQSTSPTVSDNALELLDTVLKAQLRDMLVPLLDRKVSIAERAELAHRLVRTKIESQEEAVAILVASEDPWLKSCGAYAIGSLGMKSLESELNRCLNDADPLLRETARMAKLRLQGSAGKA